MIIPVISVVGKSNSGKTTYLEKLIRELKGRGWRLATVKHHHTPGIELDKPGKDTWRHAQAGADVVVIACPTKLGIIEQLTEELSIDEITSRIQNVDLILTEGYKRGNKPKIEIFRSAVHQELLCQPEELVAIVSDIEFNVGIPCFNLDETAGVADLIEEKFLS